MLDFEVQRFTRKCCETEVILQPGDVFYSALVAQGSQVVRKDYAEMAWKGPPDAALGWWKAQVPDFRSQKMHWAPNEVILHYFEQLYEDDSLADMRYVLALLMIRRRIVRLEDTEHDRIVRPKDAEHDRIVRPKDAEHDDQRHEVFLLYCPRSEREYRVAVTSVTPERTEEIQNQLAELLFAGRM